MLEETGISIFMFGNKTEADSIVEANGCIREYEIAKEKNNLIIPIGSTGYAAKSIYDDVNDNIADYPYLSNYIDQLGTETDVDKIVESIVEIINKQTC